MEIIFFDVLDTLADKEILKSCSNFDRQKRKSFLACYVSLYLVFFVSNAHTQVDTKPKKSLLTCRYAIANE